MKRIDFFGQVRPTGIDNTAGDKYRALAGLGQQVSQLATNVGINEQRKLNKQQAEEKQKLTEQETKEAARLGIQQGAAGEQQYREDDSPQSAAYNKGLLLAYEARQKRDTKETLTRYENEKADDPEGFKFLADNYLKTSTEGLPPEMAFVVSENIKNSITDRYTRLSNAMYERERKESIAVVTESVEDSRVDILNAAREGNEDALNAHTAEAARLLDEGLQSNLLDAATVNKFRDELARQVYVETQIGKVDRLLDDGGVEDAQEYIDNIKANKDYGPQQHDAVKADLQTRVNKRKSALLAESQALAKEARETVANYENAAALGYEVSPEEKANAYKIASGDEDLTQRLMSVDKLSNFSVLPASDRSQMLTAAQTGQLDDVGEYDSMARVNAAINKQAIENGYQLGIQQGIIKPIALDVNNPDTLLARVKQADALSEHYGVDVSPITDGEAQSISNMIDEAATVDEKIQIAKTLAVAPNAWGMISKKNKGAFTVAGASGDESVMRAVFTGEELIKNKLATPPTSNDYLPALNDLVADIYSAQDKAAIAQAAVAYYAATTPTGMFDESAFIDAVESITGGIGEYNGYKLQLPRGVVEDDFEDFIDNIDTNFIMENGGVANTISNDIPDMIKSGRVISLGNNLYTFQYNGLTPPSAKDPSQPFTFSYSDAPMQTRKQQSVRELRGR